MNDTEIAVAWDAIGGAMPGPYDRRKAGAGDCNDLLIWSRPADAPVATMFARAEDARFFQMAITEWPRALRRISELQLAVRDARFFDVRMAELFEAARNWRRAVNLIPSCRETAILNAAIDDAVKANTHTGPYR